LLTAGADHTARIWNLPDRDGSMKEWLLLVRCSPYALVGGVLATNPEQLEVCPLQ
jgi:hypothetical protein